MGWSVAVYEPRFVTVYCNDFDPSIHMCISPIFSYVLNNSVFIC